MSTAEKIFFPLTILASIVGLLLYLRSSNAATAAATSAPMTPVQAQYPAMVITSGSPTDDPEAAGAGASTVQPIGQSTWALAYNQSPLVPALAVNSLAGTSQGCGSCTQAWV